MRYIYTALIIFCVIWILPCNIRAKADNQSPETWVFKGYALGSNAGNESGNISMPDIIDLGNGTYRMYYDQVGPSGSVIKYAESNDKISWMVKGVILSGVNNPADREFSIKGPSVVKLPDGRYRMYYQSSPKFQGPPEEPKLHVRSAVSPDGINFTREGVRIEISSIDTNLPLKLAGHGSYYIAKNGTYVGIFSGNFKNEMGPSSLVTATSSDGLTFGNFKKLYANWHDPIVIKTSEGYKLYATYLVESQGTAVSSDGLNWPGALTNVDFQSQNGQKLTEANSGLGDFGTLYTPDGKIVIYANWGNPSQNIAYFEKKTENAPSSSTSNSKQLTSTGPKIFLTIIALFLAGIVGFFIGRLTSPTRNNTPAK